MFQVLGQLVLLNQLHKCLGVQQACLKLALEA